MANQRKKIAVLGGGVGAVTAVYHLTNVPNWQEKYDITVYQLGWRIGGKGASGRGRFNRIEEHGPHIWYGFYENAFKMMRDTYTEWNCNPDQPLSCWESAFKPETVNVYQEQIDGRWILWPVNFPINDSTPGDGGVYPSLTDYLGMMLQWMAEAILLIPEPEGPPPPEDEIPTALKLLPWWQKLAQEVEDTAENASHRVGVLLLSVAMKLLRNLDTYAYLLPGDGSSTVHWLLEHFDNWLEKWWQKELDTHDNLRRLWILLDLVGTTVRGILADGVLTKGLASLNDQDYSQWLKKHGADPRYTIPFVDHNLYDQAFAYEDGDMYKPNFAAGTVLYTAMRTYFTYKGAFLWKMAGSMGEVVFTPFYEVLKKRGVKFEFFHRVDQLHTDGENIHKITMTIQAHLKDGLKEYNPFINVRGVICWPAEPLYDQLKEGEAIKAGGYDLESYWTPWPDNQPGNWQKELRLGQDYDMVIFGISLGAVPYLCQELVKARPEWQTMIEKVKTIQTQSFQVWLKPDDAGLGWPLWRWEAATLTGYDADDDPEQAGLDSWVDFSHLINREEWPNNYFPNNISYICGSMKSVNGLNLPPRTDVGFPDQEAAKVKRNALAFLNNYISHLWPRATQPDNPNGLNWELLVDPDDQEGEKRFDSQFWRANIDPSERYVLCVADSVRFRLKPGDSKFNNLYLAGDWTNNGLLSLGCVESAVLGGMQAANTILPQFGYPEVEIIGWAE